MKMFHFLVLAAACTISIKYSVVAQQRVVIADVFTNSHCSPCASMHAAFDEQVDNTLRARHVVQIYHHVPVYLDDELYRHNTVEPMQRASYLGGISGTPTVYLGGNRVRVPWSDLGSLVDSELAEPPVVKIDAHSSIQGSEVVSIVTIKRLSDELSSVSIYGAVVEDVEYKGRNGVVDRHNVFRRGLTPSAGLPITFNDEGFAEYELRADVSDVWNQRKVSTVIAIQRAGNGKVYEAIEQELEFSTGVGWSVDDTTIDDVKVFSVKGALLLTIMGPLDDLSAALRGHGLKGASIVISRRGDRYQSKLVINGMD